MPAWMEIARAIMHILIADDHASVRHGLIEVLADAIPDARFVEACNGDEVVQHLARSDFSVLLMDINMPGRSGLDVLRDVSRNYPEVPVVMVSVQPEDQYAMRCLQAGAAAYVNKDSATEELVPVVSKILADRRWRSSRARF
jgi:two-component system, NarL family, invasion response regulator UvrY